MHAITEPAWWLHSPLVDDYQHLFSNGVLTWTHQLPGIVCRTCGRPVGSGRAVPVECPPSLRSELLSGQGPRSTEFERLRDEVARVAGPLPPSLGGLKPGDRLAPYQLRIPSRPVTDFLWPYGGLLVSDRMRTVLEENAVSGLVFSRVKLARVGWRPSTSRSLAGVLGLEPELQLQLMVPAPTWGIQRYWQVTVTGRSSLPPGVDPACICPGCGIAEKPRGEWARRIVFEPGMQADADVFLLQTTGAVIAVTDRVRRLLQSAEATGVRFEPADRERGY